MRILELKRGLRILQGHVKYWKKVPKLSSKYYTVKLLKKIFKIWKCYKSIASNVSTPVSIRCKTFG